VGAGPLEETAADFWRMVWAEGADTVVMLCKEEEAGRV
jgi:protein tyrosine phosphatase